MGIPTRYAEKLGLYGLIPFAVLTLLSLPAVSRLEVEADLATILPDDDPLILATEEAARHMEDNDYTQIIVTGKPLFAASVLDTVEEVTSAAAALETVALVVSASTAGDVRVVDGALESRPLWDRSDPDHTRDTLTATPLFRNLLLTPGGSGHVIYVFPELGVNLDEFGAEILRLTEEDGREGVYAFGWPVAKVDMSRTIHRDLRVLGIISLLAVLIIELLIARNIPVALALWTVSASSALWTLAVYPLLGRQLTAHNVMVPVTVLALATSYGIHILRYYSGHPESSFSEAIAGVTPIVLTAAATTVVGFSSLLVTPNVRLRWLGLLIIVGILFALLASFFCLPAVFQRALRRRKRETVGRRSLLGAGARHPVPAAAGYVILITAAVLGFLQIQPETTPRDQFVSSSAPGKRFDRYHDLTGANTQLELYVDTGAEFGFVDMNAYEGFSKVIDEITALPHVPQTLAFPQFVEWMNGRLADRREPLPPENPAIIGETLELLFSQDTGLGIGALIDPSYRRAKVLFLFDNRTEQGERTDTRREALFTAIENAMTTHMPDAEYVVSGGIAFARRSEVYLRESQVISILVFFGFLVALLLYLFRDLRWALAAILPTVSGIVVYYGISGWAAMPISFVAVFFVAGLMGVSNDDVLYLTLSIRRSRAYSVPRILETLARSGGAIVQTTVIIMIGVGTFAFSSYRPLGHGGFAFAASLATCSLVTLFVVPALLRWIVTDKRLHSEPRKRSPRAPRD